MPADTPPFGWGPASFDEWDLDDLLSGRLSDTPQALRQVADALIALRASPTPGELAGEAAIMAEFSALTEFRASRPRDAARAGRSDTLVLPAPPPGAPRNRAARHRGRRTHRPLTWRAGALMGVAAAAILMIVAFTGVLPAPIRNIARSTSSSPSAGHPTGSSSQSHSVTGSGTHEQPSQSHPSATQPAAVKPSERRRLCRAWFADFRRFQPNSDGAAESALFWHIADLAGGPGHVFRYCASDLEHMFPHKNPWFRDDGTGSQQGGQGNSGSGSDNSGTGSGTASSDSTSSGGTSSGSNGPTGQGPAKTSGKGSANKVASNPTTTSQGLHPPLTAPLTTPDRAAQTTTDRAAQTTTDRTAQPHHSPRPESGQTGHPLSAWETRVTSVDTHGVCGRAGGVRPASHGPPGADSHCGRGSAGPPQHGRLTL